MTQALYAHMNIIKKEEKKKKPEQDEYCEMRKAPHRR
jgi:hypothetical protein